MPTSQPKTSQRQSLNLGELCLELARLDPTRPESLGKQAIELLCRHFRTDRISLALTGGGGKLISRVFCTGFDVPLRAWERHKIISLALDTGQPLLVQNVQERSEWLGGHSAGYRTDAFAVFPLKLRKRVEGVLCLSNLSTEQLRELEAKPPELQLALDQLAQLCALVAHARRGKKEGARIDELALISRLLERLDENAAGADVVPVFAEVVSELLPAEAIAVIYDRVREPQLGIISVHRPVHISELEAQFNAIAQQWHRRHKRAPLLAFSEARLLGGELICRDGECTPELALRATEVFPVFLDNDLFALVSLATSEDAAADRRALMLFGLMAQQLFTYVKKQLLMAQNTEMQTTDSLTGLINERQFYQMLEREFDRAQRYSSALTLLFVDIDHFKDINDTYGFEVGDQVLADLSRIVSENMRGTDFASRYSGERFVVVLPETPYSNAEVVGNRLRRYVENHSFYIPNSSVFIKVTASVGVASYLEHKPASVAQFIEYADTALYFAKRNGRNQVVGYSYVLNLMVGDTKHKG